MDTKMEARSGRGLVELLLQVSKALHRRTSEELEGIRLKPFLALAHLSDRGSVSQHELETALLIDANSVVLILNELEAAGYSVRRRDPSDRRRHLVEITESGRAAVLQAEKGRAKIEDEVLAGLSPEERETLKKLLRRVLDGLLDTQGPPAIPHLGGKTTESFALKGVFGAKRTE
jgi:DNA-binding MarR family transcriptional regulator